eukprot:CAMPEP_0194219790 /NCGR_PEP_ID=MMETSP0156-20130528/26857_1 /TAXON_ID=33649 /ORGANISM="Thalassionema nitzschioides, Strain L26-B" /LENGTH=582 /DNA_ID=CAMNT_0038949585 /DNA_START=60 /DNA_END=1805 /DNA_ORIENTATION=+
MNKNDKNNIDSDVLPALSMLRVITAGLKSLEDTQTADEREVCWECICGIIRDCPRAVEIMSRHDADSPFHLQLLHLCVDRAPLLHVFDTIVKACPQSLDIPYSHFPAYTPRFIILKYIGFWHKIGENQNCTVDLNRIDVAKHLIRTFPESLSILDEPFRNEHNKDFKESLVPEGGWVCNYIFGNIVGREYLLETLEEVYGREKLREWLEYSELTMIHRSEPFPLDAIEYLSDLYQPDSIKLILSTNRNVDDSNTVSVNCKEEVIKKSEDDSVWKTLEITFTARAERTDGFHLNNVLSVLLAASGIIPPLLEIQPEYEEGEFYNYCNLCSDADEAQELKGLEYFVLDPNVSCAFSNLESFRSIVDVTSPKQLVDFLNGVEKFPNLRTKGGSSLLLKISSAATEESNNNNFNDSYLWEHAFKILSGLQSLDCLELAFESTIGFPVTETILQSFIETTKSVEAIHVYGYRRRLNPFANGLKMNTSITELLIYGGDGYTYNIGVILDVLQHHNFTLQYVETGDEGDDALCNYYCAMNVAGRKSLFELDATKEDVIEALVNAPKKYYPTITEEAALFGLLKLRPDLW